MENGERESIRLEGQKVPAPVVMRWNQNFIQSIIQSHWKILRAPLRSAFSTSPNQMLLKTLCYLVLWTSMHLVETRHAGRLQGWDMFYLCFILKRILLENKKKEILRKKKKEIKKDMSFTWCPQCLAHNRCSEMGGMSWDNAYKVLLKQWSVSELTVIIIWRRIRPCLQYHSLRSQSYYRLLDHGVDNLEAPESFLLK